MKDQLLNEGLTATENKHMTISDLKTGLLLVLGFLLCIAICTTGHYYTKAKNMEHRFNQCSEIEAINQATINELTHDNMNLVNAK
jgi:hypothetical protein